MLQARTQGLASHLRPGQAEPPLVPSPCPALHLLPPKDPARTRSRAAAGRRAEPGAPQPRTQRPGPEHTTRGQQQQRHVRGAAPALPASDWAAGRGLLQCGRRWAGPGPTVWQGAPVRARPPPAPLHGLAPPLGPVAPRGPRRLAGMKEQAIASCVSATCFRCCRSSTSERCRRTALRGQRKLVF